MMKSLQKTVLSALSFLLLLSGCASTQTTSAAAAASASASPSASASASAAAQNGPMSGKNGGSMSTDKSADTELQALISETVSEFTQGSYTDTETGLSVPYDIYVPADYDASKTYPMVVFIGDATTVGTDMQYPLTQGWGGLIWASSEVQSSQECIVLVPVYPSTVIDDNGTATISDYLYLTPRMIAAVAQQYSVDTKRIYGTGQSMGAMTTLYLAANNPDLYAAVLIVDGQWDISALKGLESQNVIYLAAGGDQKASAGQTNVKNMLTADGVAYSELTDVDAQADREELNAQVATMLAEGNNINFLTWTAGSVLEGVSAGMGSEHMASFDYAYKLSAIRDWLFSKTTE
jgi:predicted peptidase